MKINIFADTICGWCFIGHTNLNKAIKNFSDIKFEISPTPFQLNPEMPTEGISRDKYLQIKFGGKDYATPMYENMKLKAQESGIIFNLEKIKRTPNTVLSHLLIILSEKLNFLEIHSLATPPSPPPIIAALSFFLFRFNPDPTKVELYK